MPLLRFDLYKSGWTDHNRVQQLLDIAYDVTKLAFNAPEGDRYQVVDYHEAADFIMADTGLGYDRTDQFVLLSIRTRPRTADQKQAFYQQFVAQVHEQLGIDPQDIMINMVTNTDEDWSFGMGQAQFLTGDL